MKISCGLLNFIAAIAVLLPSVNGFSAPQFKNLVSQNGRRISPMALLSMSDSNDNNGNNKEEANTCPYSMTFPRYRIPISGGKDKKNNNNILSGLFLGMIMATQKSELERKYSNQNQKVLWYDPKTKVSSDEIKNNDERIIKGKIGIHASAFVWRALSNVLQEVIIQSSSASSAGSSSKGEYKNSVVIGLPNSSLVGLKQIADIINWMSEEENYYSPPSFESKIIVRATVDEESSTPTIVLSAAIEDHEKESMNVTNNGIKTGNLNEEIVTKRTKAWVKRVLVKMQICPFTKSTTKSGQGLGDVGVPVARIAYHYSNALQYQFPLILADTWEAISDMIQAGPSGKDGVSSILLAAPEFDCDFSLWAGPLFAMLEAGVSSARAEPLIGVVCFHPEYKTPDGQSWPGFGHMHSVPRLSKWLKENDEEIYNTVDERDVSAGGAFQRRTPHATINVLRAEQLEAAEGRRSTGILYSMNIRRLYEEGFDKLNNDLKQEQNLII